MATRWGCVGAGFISSDFFTAIKDNLSASDHEFVAIAARDLDRAQKYADNLGFKKAYGSYDELINDPDVEIAYIGINHPGHAEVSVKLLNAGKHVLCEKPVTMNLKQAKQVFEAAKLNNRFFMEGIWSRFLPAYHQIKKELAEKTVGNIRVLRAEIGWQLMHLVERFQKPELGGGGLLNLGIYPIQLACMVFGEMPESITAIGNLNSYGVDETACILLKYKSGAIANLSSNLTTSGENSALIYGDKGTIKIEAPMWVPTKVSTPSGSHEYPLKDGKYNYPNGAGFQYEATAVRNYLKAGATEAEEMPLSESEMIMTIMDEVRRQIGYVLPED